MKLLNIENAKTTKGEKLGVDTYILYLRHGNKSGYNVCKYMTKGCFAHCLGDNGRMRMKHTQDSQDRKTRMFFQDRATFLYWLVADVEKAIARSRRRGMLPAFRLNGTSDIPWETIPVWRDGKEYPHIFDAFPSVQWYDYTKYPLHERDTSIPNYYLLYSRAETKASHRRETEWLDNGCNVAVVFRDKLPSTFKGIPVINGNETDVRFRDNAGLVIGLPARGTAKKDASGFVVD